MHGGQYLLSAEEAVCVARFGEYITDVRPVVEQVQLDGFANAAAENQRAAIAAERAHWRARSVRRWVLWVVIPAAIIGGGMAGYGLGVAASP